MLLAVPEVAQLLRAIKVRAPKNQVIRAAVIVNKIITITEGRKLLAALGKIGITKDQPFIAVCSKIDIKMLPDVLL